MPNGENFGGVSGNTVQMHDCTVRGDLKISQKNSNQNREKFDFEALKSELSKLRNEMERIAVTSEEEVELDLIKNAECEAKKGNNTKVLKWLSKTGKRTLDIAEKIGVSVVSAAIKSSIETP